MASDQSDFRAALLNPERRIPDGLLNGHGAPAGKRFEVYRNNVTVSLAEALQAGFPVLEKLIGPANFHTLALLFLRAHPPHSPLMMHYGADMPEFLAAFQPLAHVGYLPDVARLELALRASYHAADDAPVTPEALAGLHEDSRLTLAPSVALIRSGWPLYDIWRFNTEADAPKPQAIAQNVVVLRPEFDPEPHPLTPAEGDWLDAVTQGKTLGAAIDAAQAIDSDFDMTRGLTLLVQGNAISGISPD